MRKPDYCYRIIDYLRQLKYIFIPVYNFHGYSLHKKRSKVEVVASTLKRKENQRNVAL